MMSLAKKKEDDNEHHHILVELVTDEMKNANNIGSKKDDTGKKDVTSPEGDEAATT